MEIYCRYLLLLLQVGVKKASKGRYYKFISLYQYVITLNVYNSIYHQVLPKKELFSVIVKRQISKEVITAIEDLVIYQYQQKEIKKWRMKSRKDFNRFKIKQTPLSIQPHLYYVANGLFYRAAFIVQGRRKVWQSRGASIINVVAIICPFV